MNPRLFGGLALAGALLLSSGASPAADITLDEAIRRAAEANPDLQAERAGVVAIEQQAAFDSLGLPYTVGAEVENFGGTGDLSGVDLAETTLRVGRTFELGGKREARRALGNSRIVQQQHSTARHELDVATETSRRFFDVLGQQSRLELAKRELELVQQTRDAVAYRVKRGASPEADLPYSEVAVARAELELEDATHELESARVALAVLWGEPSPDFERARGTVDALRDAPAFDELRKRLPDNADLYRFALEAATLKAEGRVAEAAAKPDVHGTLGVRRLEGLDDQALVMSFSMPVGIRTRADLATARNRADQERLSAERRAVELDQYRTFFARYEELRHFRARFEALRDRMIPSAERALSLTKRGYDEARYSFLQLAQAQNAVQALRRERIAAAIEYQKLLTDLERATAAAGDISP